MKKEKHWNVQKHQKPTESTIKLWVEKAVVTWYNNKAVGDKDKRK